jgi:AsmA protein
MPLFKKLLIALLALPLIAFVVLLIALDNPAAYQTMLTERFHDETKLNLKIDGEITWRYWPPVAISISGISVTPDHTETPLATLQSANIDIQVMPLLTSGKILIDQIHVNGVQINALIDKDGKENWAANDAGQQNEIEIEDNKTPTDSNDVNMELDISEFSITDATIRYQDQRDDSQYVITLDTFTSDSLRADQPANINLKMQLEDQKAKITNKVEVDGQISFNSNLDKVKFEEISIQNQLNQPALPEILATIKMTGELDTKKDTVNIQNGSLTIGPLNLSFSVDVAGLSGTPKIEGKISATTFDAKSLLTSLEAGLPAMQNQSALTAVSFEGDFSGTSDKMKFEKLIAKFDGNTLEGNSTLTNSPSQIVEFNLRLDQINLSDYMEPIVTAGSDNAAVAPDSNKSISPNSDSEVIPVSILEATRIDGVFNINELTYDEYIFNEAQLTVINQKDGFRLNAKASGYGGELAMQTQIRDIDKAREPRGKFTLVLKDMNMATLTELDSLTGTLAMDASNQFSGNMLSEILASVNGKSNFTITNGTLNVKPIKSLALVIEGIQGKTSSISAWPDLLPFKRLEGSHQFIEGIEESQQFSFAMENMEVNGNGGIDYFANNLSYDIEATLKENIGGQFTVSKNIADIRWPLHCAGSLDATATDLCLADKGAITKLVTALATQAIQKKGKDKLLEKVPDEYKDTAKKLLEGLFN